MQTELLAEIRDFLSESGMSAKYFGKRAANNTYVVDRLESGRPIQTDTVEKLRNFMAEQRAKATVEAAE